MNQRVWRELNSKDLSIVRVLMIFGSLLLGEFFLWSEFLLCSEPVYAQFDPEEIERVYQTKDYAKVEAIAQARLQIDPYDVRARYYLASVLLKQKRGGQALVQYQACVKCGGNSTLAQMARKAILALQIDAKRENPQFFERVKAVSKGAAGNGAASGTGPGAGAASGTGAGTAGATGNADSLDSDDDPINREAIALLRKDLADAIEVKRRRQSQDLELVAEEENQAILEAATSLSLQPGEMIEAVRAESAAKRAKIYRLYKEEEDSITKAYQSRINALRQSHRKAP